MTIKWPGWPSSYFVTIPVVDVRVELAAPVAAPRPAHRVLARVAHAGPRPRAAAPPARVSRVLVHRVVAAADQAVDMRRYT